MAHLFLFQLTVEHGTQLQVGTGSRSGNPAKRNSVEIDSRVKPVGLHPGRKFHSRKLLRQIDFRQSIQSVVHFRLQQIMGYGIVVVGFGKLHSQAAQHNHRPLQVVAHLFHRRIFQQAFQRGRHRRAVKFHVESLRTGNRHSHTLQPRQHGVGRRRDKRQAAHARTFRLLHPAGQRLRISHHITARRFRHRLDSLGRRFKKLVEQRALRRRRFRSRCRNSRSIGTAAQHTRKQRAELQFAEQAAYFVGIQTPAFQFFRTELHRSVGGDGCQFFGEKNIVDVRFDFRFQRTFQLSGIGYDVLHRAVFQNQFRGRFLAHARTADNIVDLVAHQRQQVNHLLRLVDAEQRAHLFRTADFSTLPLYAGTVDFHVAAHELTEVLVGRHDIGGKARLTRLERKRADNVVGLIALHLHNRNAVGTDNVLNIWNGRLDILGRSLAARLVFGIHFVAERLSRRVEAHGNVRRLLLFQNFLQRVHKAENGRCVQPFRCHALRILHRIVGTENQRIGIQQKQFLFFHIFRRLIVVFLL